MFSTLAKERAVRDQVRSTSAILADLRAVLRAATDAETGQRGYVITGEASYLAPYADGNSKLPLALNALDETLRPIATPEQRASLDRLRAASEAKLAELARTVELVENGNRASAIAIVETDEGLNLMRDIRAIILELEAFEEQALATALTDAEIAETQAILILSFISVFLLIALILGLWQIIRTAQAETQVRNVVEITQARERADLLARELNHRVKNLFAVVSSIAGTTIRGEKHTEIAAEKVQQRIRALAVAHEVSQGTLERPIIQLEELVRATLAPYEGHHDKLSVVGEPLSISSATVTPLGLVLHELATNAVKYGAWSVPDGHTHVEWNVASAGDGEEVVIKWREDKSPRPASVSKEGFGSRMMKLAAMQLDGTVNRTWRDDGIEVDLIFPLTA